MIQIKCCRNLKKGKLVGKRWGKETLVFVLKGYCYFVGGWWGGEREQQPSSENNIGEKKTDKKKSNRRKGSES